MSDGTDLVEVQLLRVPVHVQLQAAEHHDALVRELTLIQASSSADSLPRRLLDLTDEVRDKFARFSVTPRAALESAQRQGERSIDIRFRIPRESGEGLARLVDLLDEADEYCRQGEHLVTLATPPVAVAYRRWLADEFTGQLAGRPPRPWTTPAELLTDSAEWPTVIDGTTATVTLSGDLDLATAPPLRDHLSHLHAGGVRTFVLDTSGVSFIDSVGLSVILALYRRCRDEDGAVTIKSPSRVMYRTLEVAGLLDVLAITD
jgi:anti-anti-sigma factor